MAGEMLDRLFMAGFHACIFSLTLTLAFAITPAWCQSSASAVADDEDVTVTENQVEANQVNTSTNEDPEAARRVERGYSPSLLKGAFEYKFYGSVRLHVINAFAAETDDSEIKLGDGASRVGVSGEWHVNEKWNLFGRLESGFDLLDSFTEKAQNDYGGDLIPRLHYLGLESDFIYLKFGKSWSAYYQVAGVADRFSIFGGNATGIYNAGTDGGATGTGRADNALQTRAYLDLGRWSGIKPFNLNLQYQNGEPIPKIPGASYGSAYSFSAWLEAENDLGLGIAWHQSNINGSERSEFVQAGISGDARALAVAFKTYGDRWLVSLVYSRLENIETTDQSRYFDGTGMELFAQWQFRDRWWLTGGGNYLDPDDDDPDGGEYQIRYLVLGVRYTFDSFNRMLYAEWRNDQGTLVDGTGRGNEFTVGFRWDFGY